MLRCILFVNCLDENQSVLYLEVTRNKFHRWSLNTYLLPQIWSTVSPNFCSQVFWISLPVEDSLSSHPTLSHSCPFMIIVSWVVTPCRLMDRHYFCRGIYFYHLQGVWVTTTSHSVLCTCFSPTHLAFPAVYMKETGVSKRWCL